MDQRLEDALKKVSDKTYDYLCDSFNTPAVMAIISELISAYNFTDRASRASETTRNIAQWVTSMVNSFGLNGAASPDETKIGWTGIDIPEEARPYLLTLSNLRDNLREKARASKALSVDALQQIHQLVVKTHDTPEGESNPYKKVLQKFESEVSTFQDSSTLSKDVLQLCDRVRDFDLWNLGIYLEDRGGQPALIRPVTRSLHALREEKEERERQKEKTRFEKEKDATAKADKARLSHLDLFQTKEYSQWDADGLPLKDADGVEIPKSKAKRLRKEWDRQKKLHETWKSANGTE